MHNFKKNFGQNFLKGFKFPNKLIEAIDVNSEDTIVEIGPGDGSITSKLIATGAQILSFEIDYDLLPTLLRRFSENKNFNLVHEDILQTNIEEQLKKIGAKKEIKVIGALPYNISKRIIDILIHFNLSSNEHKITRMAFIVQEEVSKEYTAQAPKATFLSNIIRLYANVRKLETIPAEMFTPRPKVNGGILRIELIEPNNKSEEILKLIKIGFTSPRKTLLRNLKNSNKWETEELLKAFTELGIKETARAAELEHSQWLELFTKLPAKIS